MAEREPDMAWIRQSVDEMFGMAKKNHTQECLDAQLMHHAATGGDIEECHCPEKPGSEEEA